MILVQVVVEDVNQTVDIREKNTRGSNMLSICPVLASRTIVVNDNNAIPGIDTVPRPSTGMPGKQSCGTMDTTTENIKTEIPTAAEPSNVFFDLGQRCFPINFPITPPKASPIPTDIKPEHAQRSLDDWSTGASE